MENNFKDFNEFVGATNGIMLKGEISRKIYEHMGKDSWGDIVWENDNFCVIYADPCEEFPEGYVALKNKDYGIDWYKWIGLLDDCQYINLIVIENAFYENIIQYNVMEMHLQNDRVEE